MSEPLGRGAENTKRDSKTRHATRKKGYVKRGFKKEGGGGKYTYGRPGDELTTIEFPNPRDPVREPESDQPRVPTEKPVKSIDDISAYKKVVRPIIEEYFISGDLEELQEDVEALDAPYFGFELVKRAIVLSLDRTDRERDLVSRMSSSLYSTVLSSMQIKSAFEALFEQTEDLKLDCPQADSQIARFLARAVMDEVLPPSFISDRLASGVPVGAGILQQAVVLLSVKRSGSMLEHIWSIGADAPLNDLKQSITVLVQEYLASLDLIEAAHCIKELNVPHFHHEVVKRACVIAMDRGEEDCESVSALLCFLFHQEIITSKQAFMGFQRIEADLDDLMLDIPSGGHLFATIITRAVMDGVISEFQADQLLLE